MTSKQRLAKEATQFCNDKGYTFLWVDDVYTDGNDDDMVFTYEDTNGEECSMSWWEMESQKRNKESNTITTGCAWFVNGKCFFGGCSLADADKKCLK